MDAVTMLTIYLVLLYGFPSNLSITVLGSFGRPQFLWGLLLFAWWVLARFQAPDRSIFRVSHPVRIALVVFLLVCLLSFAQAMLRGQPFDQVSPAASSVARLVSWTGVVLVAVDGIRTMGELMTLVRRLALAGSLVAALGVLQFVTDNPIIGFMSSIPGFSGLAGGLASRGDFVRATGTATHALEYSTAICVALPLVIACAIIGDGGRKRARWWIPVAVITVASFVAVTRSAIVGFAVAVIGVIPGVPRRFRPAVIGIVTVAFAGAMLAVPGLYGTLLGMFLGIGNGDSSAESRSVALSLVPVFMQSSPLLGAGLGTFLPRYYLFDNQWAQMCVEIGILGVAAFAAMLIAGIYSAWTASRGSRLEDLTVVGRALAASVLTVAVSFYLYDGLGVPMSSGALFLVLGLCAAARTVGKSDAWLADLMDPGSDVVDDGVVSDGDVWRRRVPAAGPREGRDAAASAP